MSKMSKREYLIQLKKKYWKANRKEKSRLLNDFCEFTKYNRKYAIYLIRNPLKTKWKRKNRKKQYDQEVIDKLLILWRASNEVCAERFHPYIPAILKKMKQCDEIKVSKKTEDKLHTISLPTVRRKIQQVKRRSKISISTTKPGSILRKHIIIRYGRWSEKNPGWCEMDTVSHCGGDSKGEYVSSLNLIDIATGWSEEGAVWGKGERATVAKLKEIKEELPFPLKGIDPDNGSEFINWHMYRYCRKNKIGFTRGRPYYPNDNAHIEQKNYTAIRQLIGYGRLDKEQQLKLLDELYRGPWRLYLNFFQPSLKLKEVVKDTATGRKKKRYYEASTPYHRLINHPKVTREQKLRLICTYQELNPVKLQKEIKERLEQIRRTLR